MQSHVPGHQNTTEKGVDRNVVLKAHFILEMTIYTQQMIFYLVQMIFSLVPTAVTIISIGPPKTPGKGMV